MKIRYLLPLLLMLVGCVHHPVTNQAVSYVVSPDCIDSVSNNDKTYCSGADAQHLRCYNINMKLKPNCGHFEVTHK